MLKDCRPQDIPLNNQSRWGQLLLQLEPGNLPKSQISSINRHKTDFFPFNFVIMSNLGVSRLRLLMSKSADEIIDASIASWEMFFFFFLTIKYAFMCSWNDLHWRLLCFPHTASLFVEGIRVCLSGWMNTRRRCLFTSDKSKIYLCNLITYFGELSSGFRCFPQHTNAA